MKAWLIPIALTSLVGTARADQCQWLTKAQADKAQLLLTSSSKFIDYCEPCGDPAPGIPQQIGSANAMVPAASYWELSLNGKPIDLAYVFVKTSDTEYKNLAKLAGCPASGVSASLTVAPETPTGVLIMPDKAPEPPPPPPPLPATIVTSVPSYVAPPPPPQVFVYTTTTHEIAWLAIALAATGGLITGSALMLAFVALRRRRAMRPRAMDITARAE